MMVVFRNLLWKELYELARQPWMLLGAFLIPLYLLHISTTLVRSDAPTVVVVAYPGEALDPVDLLIEQLSRIDGIAAIAVEDTNDINRLMARHRASVGIVLSRDAELTYVERSSVRSERRLNFERAARIDRALEQGDRWLTTVMAGYIAEGGSGLAIRHLSVMPGPDSQTFVPRFLALVTLLLATVLGARSMLREVENRTLQMLLTAPHSSWTLVIAAKLIFIVALTIAVSAFLLLTLNPLFGFYLRPGVTAIYGTTLLAALSSACIGAGLALLGRSATHAYLTVSVYLIASLVLTGFADNQQELVFSGETILRALFPLTYLRPVLEGWLFFGEPPAWRQADLVALSVHAGVSLTFLSAIAGFRRRQF